MDLGIRNHLFIVGGAGSGLGKATAIQLISEGATVIAIGRSAAPLEELRHLDPGRVETLVCDITEEASIEIIKEHIGGRQLHGMLVNAGGPPARTFMETSLEDWDQAYRSLLRWKVAIAKELVPLMQTHQYGRLLFIESSAVKQPLENLVLSNSLRVAVVAFVKTLSQEMAKSGITFNVLGPGSHDTPAIERVYRKKAEQSGISLEKARELGIGQVPVGSLGRPENFAALACWLLSPQSAFITGQTISVDGGMVKGIFG
jgi:3-oxoacyl-[acyl-carrier protein] reductase